jgi:hypothetical protein
MGPSASCLAHLPVPPQEGRWTDVRRSAGQLLLRSSTPVDLVNLHLSLVDRDFNASGAGRTDGRTDRARPVGVQQARVDQ